MSIVGTAARGLKSVTLDNLNLSQDYSNPRGIGRGALALVGGKTATYEGIYRESLWVSVCVNKLSRAVGRLPLPVYREPTANGARQRERTGWLPDLLSAPAPGMAPSVWKQSIVGNLGLYGNAITVKERQRPNRPPSALIPSSWAYWSVVPGTDKPIDYYVFHAAPTAAEPLRVIPFEPSEVIHFRHWGPGPGLVSPSPLEALARTLKIEDAAVRTQIASYENGMRPVGAYSVQQQLKPEVATRLRAQLNDMYGGVDNAFKVALMEGGAKWEPMSHNLVDAAVIEARRLTREECAAAYDIPPPMIGILDRATFSNVSEQHRMMYQDTLGPWITLIEETLQNQLIDPEPLFDGLYVEFNLNEVLKGDTGQRFSAYQAAQWWLTPNEVRERENLPRIDDPRADAINVPLSTGPVGAGSPPPGQAEPPPSKARIVRKSVERDESGLIRAVIEEHEGE